MAGLRSKLKESKFLIAVIMLFRKIFRCNIIKKGKGNRVEIVGLMKAAHVDIRGRDNFVTIKNPITNVGLSVFINGNNNQIKIEEGCVLKNLHIWIEDDKNEIFIGKDTLICGETKLSCIEGRKLFIGQNCMFSDGIDIRTGDSHSILNKEGARINPSLDVKIGEHVWLGQGVTILKGVSVCENSIIGTRAVVTKSFDEAGIVIAGNPAQKVKENINWNVARLSIKEG